LTVLLRADRRHTEEVTRSFNGLCDMKIIEWE
jgi:hypothetical protein